MEFVDWSRGHVPELVALWSRACPAEPLTLLELARGLEGGTILATADATAAIAFVQGSAEAWERGNIRLLVVAPEVQRRGVGRALVAEAEAHLRSRGVRTIRLAGGIPRYLWPGIDSSNAPALALAAAQGYSGVGHAVNMSIATSFRARGPSGVRVQPMRKTEFVRVRELVETHWPLWLTEVDLAASQETLWGAWRGHSPVGFIAHSTMRRGWIGPMGTDPAYRRRGIGAALLSAACADLSSRGFPRADIAWVGPEDYFAALGAKVHRHFDRYVKALG